MKKNYFKIVLDLLMAITFALLMNPRVLDGLPFHEIAGLIIGVAILTHIGLNFRWVKTTTLKIFDSKLPGKTRFSYLLNILLLISMVTVIITGILISRVVFPNLGGGGVRGLHSFSADLTLALVGLHVGVHWHWVMGICKRAFKKKDGKLRIGSLSAVVLSLAIVAGGIQWFTSTSTASKGNFKRPPFQQGQSFDKGANFQGQQPNRAFGDRRNFRHDGQRGGRSPFLILFNYLGIMAVIIIPTYYIEKRILKNKSKTRNEA